MANATRSWTSRLRDGLTQAWLDGRGLDVPDDGVPVVRLVAPPEAAERWAGDLARLCTRLESESVRSPSWLTLSQFQPRLWPSQERRVLLTMDNPPFRVASRVGDVLEEFGWSALVFLDASARVDPARARILSGAGLTCGLYWPSEAGVATVEKIEPALERLRALCGYRPRHLAGEASLDVLARVGRELGCAATFGSDPGLASARDDLGVQPRLMWGGRRDDARVLAWARRDAIAIASHDARNVISGLVRRD